MPLNGIKRKSFHVVPWKHAAPIAPIYSSYPNNTARFLSSGVTSTSCAPTESEFHLNIYYGCVYDSNVSVYNFVLLVFSSKAMPGISLENFLWSDWDCCLRTVLFRKVHITRLVKFDKMEVTRQWRWMGRRSTVVHTCSFIDNDGSHIVYDIWALLKPIRHFMRGTGFVF